MRPAHEPIKLRSPLRTGPAAPPPAAQPPARRVPWYARFWKFLRLVNRRFETGPISAGIMLLVLLLAFLCLNPFSRVAFRLFLGR